jgi:hypothetical protein
MVQPGRSAIDAFQRDLDECLDHAKKTLNPLEIRRIKHIALDNGLRFPAQNLVDLLEHRIAYFEKLKYTLEQADPDDLLPRPFGQVAFMPPLEPSKRGFMRDWSLIRLDQGTTDPVPTNKVVVGRDLDQMRFSCATDVVYDGQFQLLGVMLKGVMSPDRMRQRQSVEVAKRGAATGLTFGVTNEIKAVVRCMDGIDRVVCWEWIVIAHGGADPFSKPGDSGSCVFDMNGQVVGLLTGGNLERKAVRCCKTHTEQDESLLVDTGAEKSNRCGPVPSGFRGFGDVDLTFVTPFDKVFEDIEGVTGCKPSIA